jgi:tRNA splicing ligase
MKELERELDIYRQDVEKQLVMHCEALMVRQPYAMTLKSNGCIIFIAALSPFNLLVTLNHSLGLFRVLLRAMLKPVNAGSLFFLSFFC